MCNGVSPLTELNLKSNCTSTLYCTFILSWIEFTARFRQLLRVRLTVLWLWTNVVLLTMQGGSIQPALGSVYIVLWGVAVHVNRTVRTFCTAPPNGVERTLPHRFNLSAAVSLSYHVGPRIPPNNHVKYRVSFFHLYTSMYSNITVIYCINPICPSDF